MKKALLLMILVLLCLPLAFAAVVSSPSKVIRPSMFSIRRHPSASISSPSRPSRPNRQVAV